MRDLAKTLEFRHIGKYFPGVRALDDISFTAEGGKILAIMGENGAGKSTLLKILSGDIRADEGEVLLNGNPLSFTDPHQALKAGISIIYQERQLYPALTVAENIFPEELPRNKLGLFDKKGLYEKARAIIGEFGLDIDPRERVGNLNVAYQQMVEIMKAVRRDPEVIAFDEPTAPLTTTEIEILFNEIRKLKEQGKIVLYVSHRMSEIFQICDDIVVLKDGGFVTSFNVKETTEADLIKAMVGRDIGDTYSSLKRNTDIGDVVLEVKNLKNESLKDVSFKIHKGEIVGLAGLVGAGRTETVRAIFGADRLVEGEVFLDGEKVNFKSPQDAIRHGVFLCPEDRKEQGLIMFRTVADNICLPSVDKMSKGAFINKKEMAKLTEKSIEEFAIRTPTQDKIVFELSGGNQQKVILARWINSMVDTKVLILDEPTKGIDVGTKAEIYRFCCELACRGIAIIFISSELTEVINIADTIIVMHNGHITGQVKREEATEENVLALAMLE